MYPAPSLPTIPEGFRERQFGDGFIGVPHKEADTENLPELSACRHHCCHSHESRTPDHYRSWRIKL